MRLRASVSVVLGGLLLSGCMDLHPARVGVVTVNRPATPVATHRSPPRPAPVLVRWRGPVEQLFVHPLVLRPQRAFTDDALGRGFANYFVTAREFRAMLDQLWRHGWTLVDPRRVAAGDVRVPRGRKPLVLQEDDVNYYGYFAGRGLASRLVLDEEGLVKAEQDVNGEPVVTDQDVVPLVDEMVA